MALENSTGKFSLSTSLQLTVCKFTGSLISFLIADAAEWKIWRDHTGIDIQNLNFHFWFSLEYSFLVFWKCLTAAVHIASDNFTLCTRVNLTERRTKIIRCTLFIDVLEPNTVSWVPDEQPE